MLDGALARRTNRVTKFGGVLDSTLDRVSEAAVLIGIAVFYANRQSTWGVALAGITMISSQLVSYIRAKAEALKSIVRSGFLLDPKDRYTFSWATAQQIQ